MNYISVLTIPFVMDRIAVSTADVTLCQYNYNKTNTSAESLNHAS